jgi:hypothetical protein
MEDWIKRTQDAIDEYIFRELDRIAHLGCNGPDMINIECPYNGSCTRKKYWKKVKEI